MIMIINLNKKFEYFDKCPVCKKKMDNKKIKKLENQVIRKRKIKLSDFDFEGKKIKIVEKCKCGEEYHYYFDIYKSIKERI